MNLSEYMTIGVAKAANLFLRTDDWVEKKTGKSLSDRMAESREKDEALREKKPVLWALKKVAIGTIKGITGASLTRD